MMSTTPPVQPSSDTDSAPLNPALKQVHDASYGPDQKGTDPMATVSVKKEEGTFWPMIWLVVTILCILITIFLWLG